MENKKMIKDAVVLLPCYNPDEKIMEDFLEELSKTFKNIVIINDGCSKIHEPFFQKLEKKYPIFNHYINFGKGRGIKNGLNYILNHYPDCKVILTADCDGQHSISDIKKCYEASLKNPNAYVLGYRDFESKCVPFKSKFGNKITNLVFKLFVGLSIRDTQTGLRAMSKSVAIDLLDVSGERYEYETNTLITCKTKDIPLKQVPIKTIYINNNKTSHFNPIKDSFLIYKLFIKYIFSSLSSFFVDILLFTLFLSLFKTNIVMATIFSRILSSVYNYIVNAKIVFKKMNKASLIKFFCLVFIQMWVSAFLVTGLSKVIFISPVLIKILVDFVLFIINFIVQREWIFEKK